MKGDRYQNSKHDKKNKSDLASSMEFDPQNADNSKGGRSKSVSNKNLLFGG